VGRDFSPPPHWDGIGIHFFEDLREVIFFFLKKFFFLVIFFSRIFWDGVIKPGKRARAHACAL